MVGACVTELYWADEEPSTVIALRVFGVIVAFKLAPAPLFMSARKAAVLGEGGGKETGPPTRGVRPEPGVSPKRGVRPRGVRPVLKEDSKGRWEAESEPC